VKWKHRGRAQPPSSTSSVTGAGREQTTRKRHHPRMGGDLRPAPPTRPPTRGLQLLAEQSGISST
jgi:hypothetical protein